MDRCYIKLVEVYYCKNCKSEVEGRNEFDSAFYLTFGRRIYPTYRIRPPRKVCSNCGYPYIYSKGYKFKFVCPKCGTIKYLDNRPDTYKCPLCEKEFKIEGQTGCFIATYVFENSDVWEISVFKKFRDKLVLKISIVRYLIKLYYKFSPLIAINLGKNKFLKGLIREILKKLAVILSKLISF
jgi:hypothetical protein